MIFQIIEKKIFIQYVCLNDMTDEYNFIILEEKEDIPQDQFISETNKKIKYKLIGFISDSNYKNILQFITKYKKNSKYQKNLIYEILNNTLIKKKIKSKLELYLNI